MSLTGRCTRCCIAWSAPGFVAVRWETPERGVPRKYYRLTDSGRDELARLKHEWNAFVSAMAKLLANEEEK